MVVNHNDYMLIKDVITTLGTLKLDFSMSLMILVLLLDLQITVMDPSLIHDDKRTQNWL